MARHPFAAVNLISDPIHGYLELTKRLARDESAAAGLPDEDAAEDDLLDTAWLQLLDVPGVRPWVEAYLDAREDDSLVVTFGDTSRVVGRGVGLHGAEPDAGQAAQHVVPVGHEVAHRVELDTERVGHDRTFFPS